MFRLGRPASFDGRLIEPAALYLLMSVARASHAVGMVRISAIVLFCFERCMAVSRFGMAMAARMPMIATTISSSIRVKPFWFLLIHVLLWFWTSSNRATDVPMVVPDLTI